MCLDSACQLHLASMINVNDINTITLRLEQSVKKAEIEKALAETKATVVEVKDPSDVEVAGTDSQKRFD